MQGSAGRYVLGVMLLALSVAAAASETLQPSTDHFSWLPGQLIPNEFGLKVGTWSDQTVRQCAARCAADASCSGFSVEKVIGDAWATGCKADSCEVKTECHAKGARENESFWLPGDREIRVPAVDAHSNGWIAGWGTLLKQQE